MSFISTDSFSSDDFDFEDQNDQNCLKVKRLVDDVKYRSSKSVLEDLKKAQEFVKILSPVKCCTKIKKSKSSSDM